MIASLQAIVVLAAFFVVPGVAWVALLAPRTPTGLPWLGAAIGASIALTTVGATALVLLGLLQPAIVVAGLVVLTAAPLVVLVRRRRPSTALRHPGRWLAGRRRQTIAAVTLAGIVSTGVLAAASHAQLDQPPLPASTTIWYYANLADSTATAGGFPTTIEEWGSERPFQTDYATFTAQSAAVFELLPGSLAERLEAYRLAIAAAVVLLAVLMLRRWFSTWLSLVGAILLVGTVRMDQRLLAYRPEAFALALALFAVWLVDRAAVERTRGVIAAAAVALALVFVSHAEVFLVLLPVVAGIALARGLVRRRDHAQSVGAWLARGAAPVLAVVAAITIGGTLLGVVANGVIAGDFRLAGYALGGSASGGGAVDVPADRLPAGWTLSGDPTWDFFVAATGPTDQSLPASFTDPRILPRTSLGVWAPVDGNTRLGLILLVVIVGTPLIAWRRLDGRRRWALVSWLVFGVGVIVGSFVLYELSKTYVPQRVGGRRLVPYELFVPVVAMTLLLWLAQRPVKAIIRRVSGPETSVVQTAVASAVLALVFAIGMVAWPANAGSDDEPGLTRVGDTAFAWMRANLPPGSRYLANAYTDGSVGELSGGVGLIDGRAVYLENPTFLGESTSLLLGARKFFADPSTAWAKSFVDEEGVDYLIVVNPSGGADIAGYRPFPTDLGALRDRYTLVHAFGGQRVQVFRVDRGAAVSASAAT